MRRLSRREWLAATGIGVAAWRPERAWGKENDLDEMIEIPPGAFLMGILHSQAEALARKYRHHVSWLSGEVPQRTVELPAYRIDKYPVTNAQYAVFCKETGYPPRPHWGGPEPPRGLLHHPVTYVNKADAETYAGWAGKRLPTEAQWEKAARGPNGNEFPWGNSDPDDTMANFGNMIESTSPVTDYEKGKSVYWIQDMAGNVKQWCKDWYGTGERAAKNPTGPESGKERVIKGGSFQEGMESLLSANRDRYEPNYSSFLFGFRCACEEVK